MENLKKYLTDFSLITPSEWDTLKQFLQEERIKKGDYFLNYNKICRKFGWIKEGVFRYVYIAENGIEYTKYFVSETQFVSASESFNAQTPSTDAIEALTDATIYTLSYDSYFKLFDLIPNWGKLVLALTNNCYSQKANDLSPMLVWDAKTRYANFLQSQPKIIQRVSLGYIASYLGMTQQSLSRLRKKLMLQ
jgi:CRP-like cAMP-binding protein